MAGNGPQIVCSCHESRRNLMLHLRCGRLCRETLKSFHEQSPDPLLCTEFQSHMLFFKDKVVVAAPLWCSLTHHVCMTNCFGYLKWVVRTTCDCFANKAIASTTKPLLTWVVRCLGPPACPPIESECLLVVVRDQTPCNKDLVSPHSKTCSRTSANTSPSRYIGKHCTYSS